MTFAIQPTKASHEELPTLVGLVTMPAYTGLGICSEDSTDEAGKSKVT